jgi:hypothetical protein
MNNTEWLACPLVRDAINGGNVKSVSVSADVIEHKLPAGGCAVRFLVGAR